MQHCLVLTGPTGSGKSALGVELAERASAEIISMDSMALYRGMDIGTAKPDADQRRRVPHHLVDVLDPWESASVAWWLEQAERCRREIEGRGKRVLFVGGTPLYLKALQCGLFDGPPADRELRMRLENEAESLGKQALHDRLAKVDPPTAARLHPNDLRRVVRALEVWELTGQAISSWQKQWARDETASGDESTDGLARPVPKVLWLDRPREDLYRRIDARVLQMIEAGLADEVRHLRELPQPLSPEAAQALGYKEMFDCLDGKAEWDETVRRIQTRTRNFAKRQITWFRHMPNCQPASEELTLSMWSK